MKAKLAEFTLCVPFYRQVGILELQIKEWNKYPPAVKVILVDDCSPEPAEPVVRKLASDELLSRLELLRVDVDKPWNRSMCRNLSSQRAQTAWVLHVDTDHILPAEHAKSLLDFEVDKDRWYRFRRFRVGKADDTRRKDKIDPNCEYGEIHPHCDSWLMTAFMYWLHPLDEDFTGCLGGGGVFLKAHEKIAPVDIVPGDICLHVYTRSVVKDASIWSLSRDTSEYSRRKRKKQMLGDKVPRDHIRLPWHVVDLTAPSL